MKNEAAGTASVEFTLEWKSDSALHRDRIFAPKINFWRDLFPKDMEIPMSLARKGEIITRQYDSGEITKVRDDQEILTISRSAFNRKFRNGNIEPRIGFFYPRGVIASAIGSFPQDVRPFRIVGSAADSLTIDLNPPLAGIPLMLSAKILDRTIVKDERGGSLNVISEIVTENGPGMQASLNGSETDFFSIYPFTREVEENDASFYKNPRFVQHLDETAIGHVTGIYENLLRPGSQILDLMTSWDSHLPASFEDITVAGLGMNTEELSSNKRLSRRIIHDLNLSPELPFKNEEFDAVICTVSVEYLTRPIEVFKETARVLKKGGVFINTF
ncbi:MAG: methyltransferase domain-containing protein, partial [Thermodesulfobacteriota bacterium]